MDTWLLEGVLTIWSQSHPANVRSELIVNCYQGRQRNEALEMLNILFKRLTQRAAENDEDALDDGGYEEERCQRVR